MSGIVIAEILITTKNEHKSPIINVGAGWGILPLAEINLNKGEGKWK